MYVVNVNLDIQKVQVVLLKKRLPKIVDNTWMATVLVEIDVNLRTILPCFPMVHLKKIR